MTRGVLQPSGQITLVFSDIEGSTRLLEELGTDAYREALAEHRRIVRDAYARYSGYEVDYEGDAFFYAFTSAPDAVAAVSAAMAGLEDGPIKIRVGIHTGEPGLDPPKYVGMDVHFAARVMSSAHGGQVVLSAATAEQVELGLTDLGEHRLKDIEDAVSLYQLGEGSFPPLKTISNTNLPRPASSFLGREVELSEVISRIEQGARLVTLSGPGGTGKTRLALEAASTLVGSYKAGVFWIGLASLRDPTLVTETIAQVLGAKDDLASDIADREMLLLLDNLEQVIEAAAELSSLLSACSNLTLLATSRELLRISGEVEYAVPPLAEPDAVSLFYERSQLSPSEEIAELCARLDSLPLAVELAAARTKALSPTQILDRLSQRLDLLKGGRDADPRQQTLRATIEWSHELLASEEQKLFARLSVFAGGCTLEAAEDVADADLDTLQSLVEKSLVRFSNERYWMLETIREFAGEQFERSGGADHVRGRHAEWVAAFVEANQQGIPAEVDNLRGALAWSRDTGRGALELRLADATRRYWANSGQVREGFTWLVGAADRGPPEMAAKRAMVMATAIFCALRQGDLKGAKETAESQLTISGPLGGSTYAAGLSGLAVVLAQDGEVERSRDLFAEAIDVARRARRPSVLAAALFNLGDLEQAQGDFERALDLSRDALEAFRLADDAQGEAHALIAIGRCSLHLGRLDEGLEHASEGLRRVHELGIPGITAVGLLSLAEVARLEADWTRAATLLGAEEAILKHTGEVREHAEEVLHHRLETECRAVLGDMHFDVAVAGGAEMTLAEAVEYALSSID